MEARVEDLIEEYRKHYGVLHQEAVEIMIEDLRAAPCDHDWVYGENLLNTTDDVFRECTSCHVTEKVGE